MYPAAARRAKITAATVHPIRDLRREKSSALTGTSTTGCSSSDKFTSGSGTLSMIEDDETRATDHRWRLHRQPRTGGMGVYPAFRRKDERNVWFRAAHHEQPHGNHRRHRGAPGASRTVRGGSRNRFGVFEKRHHHLDKRLEAQRLENGREEAGGQSGPVDDARRYGFQASNELDL